MPIFMCEKCKCVENTALSNYWMRKEGEQALCSECDPEIGKWHSKFEKKLASDFDYWIGEDGFLYNYKKQPTHTKLIEPV